MVGKVRTLPIYHNSEQKESAMPITTLICVVSKTVNSVLYLIIPLNAGNRLVSLMEQCGTKTNDSSMMKWALLIGFSYQNGTSYVVTSIYEINWVISCVLLMQLAQWWFAIKIYDDLA
jgi:hypothetical protein